MADMIVPSLHRSDIAQAPAGTAYGQEQEISPMVIEAALTEGEMTSIDLDPNATGAPTVPVVPAGPGGQPVPEEDELDELIIEDFTIDGICGVY